MPTIVIKCKIEDNFVKESLVQELYWYDNLKKELLKFNGTRLEFEYRQDPYILKMDKEERENRGIKTSYRLLPKPVSLNIVNYNKKNIKDNKKEVISFFENYLNYNNTKISIENEYSEEIIFNVPEEEVDDFTYQLERNGFEYGMY